MAKGNHKGTIEKPDERLKNDPLLSPWRERVGRVLKIIMMKDIEEIKANNPVLSKLQFMDDRRDLLRIINGAYLAERFFGKSGSWFSQKLNNNLKNGKPCEFTSEELKTLSNALYTISYELQELADNLH